MNIQPLHDFVLIRRIEAPQGLIALTDASKSIRGEIVAVGPGKKHKKTGARMPMESKVGQQVYFNSRWHQLGDNYENVDWRYDDSLHLVQEADIFGVIKA